MGSPWETFEANEIHIPRYCKKCNGFMTYQGVGEYTCDRCGFLDYDDYGRVRNFIERKPGANTIEIEKATGVSQRTIRKMLKEGRFMLTEDSRAMLYCEICRKPIRFGRFCVECERVSQQKQEEIQRKARHKAAIAGFGKTVTGEGGQKRFDRKD